MPIYEYVCNNCGTQFDALRSMNDADAVIECKKCLSSTTKRKLSVCFARSNDRQISGNSHKCSGCGGGTCSHCNN